MQLKKLMSVFLFAVLSSQSFASEEVKGEKEEGKEEETSEQTSSELTQSGASKLASILINLNLWDIAVEEVGIRLINQLGVQVPRRINSMEESQIIDHIRNVLGVDFLYQIRASVLVEFSPLVFAQIVEKIDKQIHFQTENQVNKHIQFSRIAAQVDRALTLYFYETPYLNHYVNELHLFTPAILDAFESFQRDSSLWLRTSEGQNLLADVAALLNQDLTPEHISQILESIEFPSHQTHPVINRQRAILESFLPHRSPEVMVSRFVAGVIAVAFASASAYQR